MILNVDKILLKHSNGIDKEPIVGELSDGEVVINNVSGVMYQKLQTESGEIVASTKFQNHFNVSPQAVFSIPLTANEGDVVEITIDNYISTTLYGVNITGGSIDTSSNPFRWTLPAVSDTVSHGISISTQEENKLASTPTPYQYITVSNISGIVDDAIILNSLNIDTPLFDTLTNTSIIQGALIVDGENIDLETINFEQEVEDADWSSYATSLQVKHVDMLFGVVDNLNAIKILPDIDISVDDNVYVKQEDTVKEVSVGAIENVLVNYKIKQACISSKCSVFLEENGQLHLNGYFLGSVEGITNVKKIDCGDEHMIAMKEDNSVWVIGENEYGQLGTGDTTDVGTWRFTGYYAKDIAANESNSYIVDMNGDTLSVGRNYYGELGVGNNTQSLVWLNTNIIAKKIIASDKSVCIIKEDGSVWSCGYNISGQLALGDSTNRNIFTSTGHFAIDAYMGYRNLFIKKDDDYIWAVGVNAQGQLLFGNTSSAYSFKNTNLKGKQIFTSGETTHIVKLDNAIWVCGKNDYGQCGLGHTNDLLDVVTQTAFIGGNFPITHSDAVDNNIIIDSEQRVLGSGRNTTGQLGTTSGSKHLLTVSELSKISSKIIGEFTPSLTDNISFEEYEIPVSSRSYDMGAHFAVKTDENGRVWSRGNNRYGQLGLGDETDRTTWTDTGVTNVKTVSCGDEHTIILKNDGTVWVAGYGYYGATGTGNSSNVNIFTQINLTNVKSIHAKKGNSFVIKEDGSLWGTGENTYGSLGIGTTTKIHSFVKVSMNKKVVSVDTCNKHSILLTEDGSVYTVGYNTYGNLGLGHSRSISSFTNTGFKGKRITCHLNSTAFIGMDNMIYTTGRNTKRELLLNDNTQRLSFTNTGIEAIDVAMGYYFTLFIKPDNTVWGIGENSQGQLGTGNLTDVASIIKVRDYAKTISAIQYESFITVEDDKIMITGYNYKKEIMNAVGEVKSFIYSDGDSDGTYYPITDLSIITTPGDFTVPQWMYKNTLKSFTSLEATSTKNFTEDTLLTVPEEISEGLKYKYNLVSKSGRFISAKFTGLLTGEVISEIRIELEK